MGICPLKLQESLRRGIWEGCRL